MAIAPNLANIRRRIEEAARRSGRPPDAVRLIGVTKRVEPSRIQEAIDLGLREIGENRVQEAESKRPQLALDGVQCHLIGHLQSNKARKALQLFSTIQTVDRVELAQRLDRLAEDQVRVLIQVKLGEEPTKAGVAPDELKTLVDAVHGTHRLVLEGLMGIPPFFQDTEQVRTYFRQLKECADAFSLPEVSMGMSHDFEVAIEEGATMVRIGTAIFGERNDP